MAYSRRGLGLGLLAIGFCLLGASVFIWIYTALVPCGGWGCTSWTEGAWIVFIGYAIPGGLALVTGLFFVVGARKKPLLLGQQSHGS